MNSEHKWRFWYHKTIYFSKLAICLTFEYMLFPLGNGVRGKIRPIFAQGFECSVSRPHPLRQGGASRGMTEPPPRGWDL